MPHGRHTIGMSKNNHQNKAEADALRSHPWRNFNLNILYSIAN